MFLRLAPARQVRSIGLALFGAVVGDTEDLG